MKIKMNRKDRIVAVIPERASGPGWANAPLFVYIEDWDGKLRVECVQPQHQTDDIHTLFNIGCEVTAALKRAVRPLIEIEAES